MDLSARPPVSEPLYRRVYAALLTRIEAGEFPLGSSLPKELELARQLGVSRVTLRQALAILEKGGVVRRVRKLGTQVSARRMASTYVQGMDGVDSILRLAGQTTMRIDRISLDTGTPDPGLKGLPNASGHWLRVEGLRRMQGHAQWSTWTNVYLDNKFAGIGPYLTGEVDSVYEFVERVYGLRVHTVKHQIGGRALPAQAAALMGLSRGAPALQVLAWLYASDGSLIEFVRSIHNPAVISIELTSTRHP